MTMLSSTRDPARRLRGGGGGGRGSYRGSIGRGNYGGGNYNGAGVGYAGVGDVGGDYGGLDDDGLDYGGGDYEFVHEPEEPAMVPPAPAPAAATSGRDRVHDAAAAASNHEHVLDAPEFDYEDAHDRGAFDGEEGPGFGLVQCLCTLSHATGVLCPRSHRPVLRLRSTDQRREQQPRLGDAPLRDALRHRRLPRHRGPVRARESVAGDGGGRAPTEPFQAVRLRRRRRGPACGRRGDEPRRVRGGPRRRRGGA